VEDIDMKASKLVIAIAALGTCAALPALAQDRYYPNDGRGYTQPYDSRYDNRYDSRYDNRSDRGRDRDGDVAQVIDARPVAGSGEHEECWNPRAGHYEEVRGPEKAKILSKDTAIGAVAGGVIGHQFDSGAAGTVGGALLGGLAGHAFEQHRNNGEAQDDLDRSRCRVVQGGEQAYDVTYRYHGREHVARLDHQPGPTLTLGREIDDEGEPYHKP
jgi:uncharacterized protein YcfJ